MIKTKADLRYYLERDRQALNKPEKLSVKEKIVNILFPDYNYEFVKCLRKLEYAVNTNSLRKYYYQHKHIKLKVKTGIELMPNVAGPGLRIPHGKIVVNATAQIGEDCRIQSDVTIGIQGRYDRYGAPVIGNRVFIGTGARIIGNIEIADDCVIGANAVVIHDILEPGITVAGNPARKVSGNDSFPYLNRIEKHNL